MFQVPCALGISCVAMLPAVGFDNDLAFDACEVGNVAVNGDLPAEFEPAELPIAKAQP